MVNSGSRCWAYQRLIVHGFSGIIIRLFGPVAQLVRAPPCHGGGRGFEPHRDRQHLFNGSTEPFYYCLNWSFRHSINLLLLTQLNLSG